MNFDIFLTSLSSPTAPLVSHLVNSLPEIHFTVFSKMPGVTTSMPSCAVLSAVQGLYNNGIGLVLDPDSALLLLGTNHQHKFFFISEPHWQTWPEFTFENVAEIYHGLELIADNEEMAKILTNCWKKPSKIIKNLEPTEVSKLWKSLT